MSSARELIADGLNWLSKRVMGALPEDSSARHVLRRLRWQLRLPQRLPDQPLSRLLAAFAEVCPRAVFVQIGSNDGLQQDPLRFFIETCDWCGVMVEPVPFIFDRLQAHYRGHPRLRLENCAIADRDGELPFYHLAQAVPGEHRPSWYDLLGSFHRDVILKHAYEIPDLEHRIVQRDVRCLKFESLWRRHRFTDPDLIFIDTEGYDWEIIRQIDLTRYRPVILIYEHCNLSAVDHADAQALLKRYGYELEDEGLDTVAINIAALRFGHDLMRTAWEAFLGRSR